MTPDYQALFHFYFTALRATKIPSPATSASQETTNENPFL
jgi:hypothetical protein